MKRTRKGNPKIAIGYVRHSTEDQRLSESAQRAAIGAWAAREGVTVVAWHVDAGVSGGADLADRPALAAALAALRVHGAGVLAVAKRDRLARDTMIAGMIDRAVEQAGARVVTSEGAGNGDSPADAFLRNMLDAAAAYERAMIRARTSAALRAKRAAGYRAGTVPYGYTADGEGRLAPHAGEQAVIAEVRRLRAAGLSQRAIVASLAEAGIVGRTGRALALIQVQNILAAEGGAA